MTEPAISARQARVCRIEELPTRGQVVCRGYIDSITIQPRGVPPEFSAIVLEPAASAQSSRERHTRCGQAQLRLVWIGQRHVPGIEAGTELRVEGMVSQRDGLPTIFNPRYEIIGKPEFTTMLFRSTSARSKAGRTPSDRPPPVQPRPAPSQRGSFP